MKINVDDLKVIWYFFKPYKLKCLGVMALMVCSGLLETLNLAALYPILNYGLNLDQQNFILKGFLKPIQLIVPDNLFLASCIMLIIITILAVLVRFFYVFVSNKLLIHIASDVQKRIFEQLCLADYNFYVKSQQGRLVYTGAVAPENVFVSILYTMLLGYHVISVGLLFCLMVALSWQATLCILIFGVIYSNVIQKLLQKFIHRCAVITSQEKQQKNVILNEFVNGFKTIKIFLATNLWREKYQKSCDRLLINSFWIQVGTSFPEAFSKFIFYISLGIAGLFLSQQPNQHILAFLPVFGIFILVANRTLPYTNAMASDVVELVKALPDTRLVYALCNEKFQHGMDGHQDLRTFQQQIAFSGVSFKYPSTREHLFKNLSFSIEHRKMTALVGLSGSGKTTIINLLLKLYRPDDGVISIDGTDIFDLRNQSYLSRIGYVSQETFIFNSSFKDNIRFGLSECTDEMIRQAAELANADEFIAQTSHGYDTIIGDSGIKLSGGQRQRIAIARAMLRKPEIIILDEATSSLDNLSERKIQQAINNISKHTTLLVVAHRLSTIQHADKIIILEKGQIKEEGTHEQLLANKKLYYRLYMTQGEHQNQEHTVNKHEIN